MKKSNLTLFIFVLIISSFGCSSENKTASEYSEKDVQKVKQAASEFTAELKNTLLNEIRSGGIVSAVSVCSDTAQELTNKVAEKYDLQIKRVSLKTRNKLNNPDEYQTKILKRFQEMKNSGNLTDTTVIIETLELDGNKYLSFMKPIETMPLCLNCHGENIDEEVAEVINKNYPEDDAVGYKNNELRGAVSVRKKI